MGEKAGHNVLIAGNKCYRCGHEWRPEQIERPPKVCPSCKNPYWDRPKKSGGELKYQWKCSQCTKVIKANSENTLTVGKREHQEKHQLKGY